MSRPPFGSMSYPRTGWPPIHLPFRRAADILSRVRSEMISRSNWANDRRMFSVRRPMDVVVLKLLRDRDEAHAILVKHFYNPRKVRQGSTDPVDLVDHDAVDSPRLNRGEKPLQCRAIHVGPGVAAIVEVIGEHLPALTFLADDERFACFPLSIQGIEFLLKPLLGGLARVDRAADDAFFGRLI